MSSGGPEGSPAPSRGPKNPKVSPKSIKNLKNPKFWLDFDAPPNINGYGCSFLQLTPWSQKPIVTRMPPNLMPHIYTLRVSGPLRARARRQNGPFATVGWPTSLRELSGSPRASPRQSATFINYHSRGITSTETYTKSLVLNIGSSTNV